MCSSQLGKQTSITASTVSTTTSRKNDATTSTQEKKSSPPRSTTERTSYATKSKLQSSSTSSTTTGKIDTTTSKPESSVTASTASWTSDIMATTLKLQSSSTAPSPNYDLVAPNIQKLNLVLDPSKAKEREKKIAEAKKRYHQNFGFLDMEKAYHNLFEILWYSQLPCFDVKNITSENRDDMSLVKRCYWKNQRVSCSSIFFARPTDRGMCCTFNMEKAENIFRKSKYTSALSEMQNHDRKYGFEDEALPEWFRKDNEPQTQPGQNKGLRLVLDAHTDRISPGTVFDNFRGFVTVVDGGDKYPLTATNSFLIRPGRENYVALSASGIEADEDIKSIDPEKRECYFPDENPLQMHNRYSRSSCVLECSMNYARKMIKKSNDTFGCAPWFYPATDDQYTNICNPWETKEFQRYMTNVPGKECVTCLPDCTDTQYNARVSAAPFRGCDHTNLGTSHLCDLQDTEMNPPMWTQMIQEEFKGQNIEVPDYAKPNKAKLSNIRNSMVNPAKIKELTLRQHFLANPTYDAFEKDIAIVNFYFDKPSVVEFKRSLRMTTTDFISQMGGLLGLGLGFSFVSAVEIIYWMTIRLYRNVSD